MSNFANFNENNLLENKNNEFEGFEANESDNNYQTFDLKIDNTIEKKSNNSMCNAPNFLKVNDIDKESNKENNKEPVIEKFFGGRRRSPKKSAQQIVSTVGQIAKQAAPIVKAAIKDSKAVVQATLDTINRDEFKSKVQKTTENYMIMARDTLIKVLSDPNSQHRVDEYIVKPLWDMYLIPFIDLYVLFMILYFVVFILVTIWIVRPCLVNK